MAQSQRTKSPLDLLQGMINGVLIETGKALRASNKEGGKGLSNTNNRLRGIIPSASENFHQALDELECDIIRAKSVLLRDLEELRTRRFALENPEPIVEDPIIIEDTMETNIFGDPIVLEQPSPTPDVKEEKFLDNSERSAVIESNKPTPAPTDPIEVDSKDNILQTVNGQQGPTPPSSTNEASNTKPVGLGIDTNGITTTSAPATADPQNSAIDSLFDMPDNDDNMGDPDLNFEAMDFGLDTSNSNTQGHDLSQTQTQSNDFDLSTFGNVSQDFNMDSIQTGTDNSLANNSTINNTNKTDDLLDLNNTADSMDLELDLEMGGGDDNTFDDIYFQSVDDVLGGGGEMEHEFDNAFFGLTDS